MQGHGGGTGPLPEVLEFEGRFMSSRPITNNPLLWHRDQNPTEKQLSEALEFEGRFMSSRPITNNPLLWHRDQNPTGKQLSEALEFEGRFMSSRPITNNPLRWHHDQNPVEERLPDFIPLGNDTGASLYYSIDQGGWNTQILNTGHSSSSSVKTQSGFRDRLIENERISSANSYAVAGPGSSNVVKLPRSNDTNANLTRPLNTEHAATAGSSAHLPMGLPRTGSIFREENNVVPEPAAMTSNSSEKRKFREGSWGESSARTRKVSVQIPGRSDLQAAPHCDTPDSAFSLSLSSSAASVLSFGSSGSLRSGAVPLSRSSLFDRPPESGFAVRSQNTQQNTQIRPDISMQESVPAHSVLSGTDIRYNAVVQRPRLVLPPPQAVEEGLNGQNPHVSVAQPPCLPQAVVEGLNVQNRPMRVAQRPRLVLPAPQAVEESSRVQNHPMSVHCRTPPQQSSQLSIHHNSSSIVPRNPSGSALGTVSNQVEDTRSRNAQALQLPVITPPVGSRILRPNSANFVPSGGTATAPPNPFPTGPRTASNLVSNGNRQLTEQIRQALRAVDLIPRASNPPPHEIPLQSGANSQASQRMQQRTASLHTNGRNHSNIGAPSLNGLIISLETDQRLLSRARNMIAIYRGGWDSEAPEDGVNVRQSLLSALAGVHDQHRDMRLDVDNMSYEELLELGDRIGHVKTGLSEETITKCLKHYMYTSTMKSSQPGAEPCSICQEEYTEGEDLGSLECGHEYHTNCIKQWLMLKNSCPICKTTASSSK